MPPQRYRALSSHLRERFGRRVQKVPLDAGSTCPNRDGSLSRDGCVFCNAFGSGTGLHGRRMTLARQWTQLTGQLGRKYKTDLFWAYLQSFTNTYGPLERLQGLLRELDALPGMRILSLGTRPDCLDTDKLRCIAGRGFPEVWLDIGLQSSKDKTLRAINRGHDFACFAQAVMLAHAYGVHVSAHVVHGLPGECSEDFLETIRDVSRLPVHGIKIHNLLVVRGSTLERWWRQGVYVPEGLDTYARDVAQGLELLRPDIVVHRLNADPRPGELLAPEWAADKRRVLDAIHHRLEEQNVHQGSRCQA